jgi:hypothetical protein
MAITGVHALLYTAEPDAVREILSDVFGWEHVDAGGGWLIFALPPAEVGVHPSEGSTFDEGARHELSIMCDDLDKTMDELRARGVEFKDEPKSVGWGTAVTMALPGGLDMILYQPRHQTAV